MAKKKRKKARRNACKTPGRKIRSKGRGRGSAVGGGSGPIHRRRRPNPVSLAKTILSKVAEPGSTFSLTALHAGIKKAGYRNVKGWIDDMVADARRRGLLTPVTKSLYVYTPAAARVNPCPLMRPISHKRKGMRYRR